MDSHLESVNINKVIFNYIKTTSFSSNLPGFSCKAHKIPPGNTAHITWEVPRFPKCFFEIFLEQGFIAVTPVTKFPPYGQKYSEWPDFNAVTYFLQDNADFYLFYALHFVKSTSCNEVWTYQVDSLKVCAFI